MVPKIRAGKISVMSKGRTLTITLFSSPHSGTFTSEVVTHCEIPLEKRLQFLTVFTEAEISATKLIRYKGVGREVLVTWI